MQAFGEGTPQTCWLKAGTRDAAPSPHIMYVCLFVTHTCTYQRQPQKPITHGKEQFGNNSSCQTKSNRKRGSMCLRMNGCSSSLGHNYCCLLRVVRSVDAVKSKHQVSGLLTHWTPHIKCRWHDSRPLPEPYNGPFVVWICWDNPAGQPSRHNQHTQRSMQCCCPLNNIRFCITCAVFAVCHRVVAEEPHVYDACSANVAIAAAFTVAAV